MQPVTAAWHPVEPPTTMLASYLLDLSVKIGSSGYQSLVEHGKALHPQHCWSRSPCACRVTSTAKAREAGNGAHALRLELSAAPNRSRALNESVWRQIQPQGSAGYWCCYQSDISRLSLGEH